MAKISPVQTEDKILRCRRKNCTFSTNSKFELGRHKKSCLILKSRENKSFKSRGRSLPTLNLKCALIGNKLGSGAFGSVFEAKLDCLNLVAKFVMTKGLEKEKTKKQMESLTNEKKAFSIIKNESGFPRFFGSLEVENGTYLFIEQMDETLQEFIERNISELSTHSIAEMMLSLLKKLEKLHKVGLVHRDLKWNNFLLKNGEIYLIDFGASSTFPIKRKKGSIWGSIKFMSLDTHEYFCQTHKDDLEALGWLFLSLTISRDLQPWLEHAHKNRILGVEYAETSRQIKKMKEDFLKHTEKSFVVEYLEYATKIPFSKVPNPENYKILAQIIETFLENEVENRQYWKNLSFPKGSKTEEWISVIKKSSPIEFYNKFEEFSLSKNMQEMYIKKIKLTSWDIEEELKNHHFKFNVDYFYVDLTKNNLKKYIESEKQIVVLVYSNETEEETGHFSTYLFARKRFLSFNGISPEPSGLWDFEGRVWKNVEQQNDNWSCGYRALFWIMNVLQKGVKEWIFEKEVIL